MLQILYPFHGAVLNHRHGRQDKKQLIINVTGTAPVHARVTVNGVPAERNGELFTASIPLSHFENTIEAVCDGIEGAGRHTIKVIWDQFSRKRFRLCIDDNIFFLRDLAKRRPQHILDNLYLGQLKKLHDEFGVKISLNLFYSTIEHDFNLSMMPPAWRSQFQASSDWLRMTWHARSEMPNHPYIDSSAAAIIEDMEQIRHEVIRFAGEECWCTPSIIHWGDIFPSELPKLHEYGINALSGFFQYCNQRYSVSYSLDTKRCAYLSEHDALMDFSSGIVFSRNDMVFNLTPLEEVVPKLTPLLSTPDHAEYMDLLTHEQYFWPFYFNYIPGHANRIAAGLRLLVEHGYEPVWQHEGFLGVEKART